MAKVSIDKVKSMSKEEKLKLYDLIQKKKELAKRNRDKFKPHEGQLEVLMCDAKIRVVTAANGYGKTALGVNAALAAVNGYNPWLKRYTQAPTLGVVVLDNPSKVKDVWLKEMDFWHDMSEVETVKNGKPYINELVFKNGSRIIFMFHEQDQLVFESIEVQWVVYDEPPPKGVFLGLSRGARTKGSKPWQLLIGTPISAAWIRQDLYEPWTQGLNPDVEFFVGRTEQNRANLAEGYIESFSRLLSEDEKKVRLEGQFFDLGGLALAHLLKDDVHRIPDFNWGNENPVFIGIDPHPSKSHVAVALGLDKETGYKYVIGELCRKATARDFAEQLLDWSRNWRVVDWNVDSLGSADTSGGEGFKSFIQVLKDHGIRARATSFEDKKDEEWIERIKGALEIPKEPNNYGEFIPQLRVFSSCVGTYKEFKNVAWLRYKNHEQANKPKLDISNKDFLAALKYALAAASTAPTKRNQDSFQKISLSGRSKVSIRSRYMKR